MTLAWMWDGDIQAGSMGSEDSQESTGPQPHTFMRALQFGL